MICKLCKIRKVKDLNLKIHICSICRMEIELSFQYFIDGEEITKEEYDQRIENAF